MLNIAYLSLGSNIEPEMNMKEAIRLLAYHTKLVAVSSVWETKPVGLVKQANFLNAAAIVQTAKSADNLKWQTLQQIETTLGRVRQANKNAPRPMDIDIMLFNRQILDLGHRRIPDPEILERPFVAIPLAEIAPDYIHPETGQKLQEIANLFPVSNDEMRLRQDISQTVVQLIASPRSVYAD